MPTSCRGAPELGQAGRAGALCAVPQPRLLPENRATPSPQEHHPYMPSPGRGGTAPAWGHLPLPGLSVYPEPPALVLLSLLIWGPFQGHSKGLKWHSGDNAFPPGKKVTWGGHGLSGELPRPCCLTFPLDHVSLPGSSSDPQTHLQLLILPLQLLQNELQLLLVLALALTL